MAHKISLQSMQSMLNESSSHSSHLNYVEMEVCVSYTGCCGQSGHGLTEVLQPTLSWVAFSCTRTPADVVA